MKNEVKKEEVSRSKIIFIVILSVIFLLVAYFRFFHNKSIRATNLSPASPPAAAVNVPPVQPDGLAAEKTKDVPAGTALVAGSVTRNIFTPVGAARSEGEAPAQTAEKTVEKAPPTFKLTGVIVDQVAAVAVINGRFLKKGDIIEDYQVVRIEDKAVTLSGNGQKITLNVLTSRDK